MRPTRRELFRICGSMGAGALATSLTGCGDDRRSSVLDNDELALLEAFADVILPPDDEPGGAALGVVAYTERLLTAFAVPTAIPAIFASGPFSDRNPIDAPIPNDFDRRVELDRIADAAWRLRLLGGSGPNEDLFGPVIGLADQLRDGLRAALELAVAPLPELSTEQRVTLFDAQPDDFKSLVFDLVTEAAFAAPEYGGNPGGAGWALCHFEGDSLPLGYTQVAADGTFLERADAPHSGPNPGADPAPLDGDVADVISTAIRALGGRDNS